MEVDLQSEELEQQSIGNEGQNPSALVEGEISMFTLCLP
jgi:hypothetical protein